MALDDGNPFSDLVPQAEASDSNPFGDLVPQKDRPKLDLEAPVGSEGFLGGVADFGRGVAHGVISGLPTQIGKAAEFFGAEETGKKLQELGKATDLPALRTSVIGQRDRAEDVLSIRGAAGEAGENTPLSVGPGVAGAAAGAALGSVVPGLGTAAGAAGGFLVGSLAALPIFYGSQAQESKEAIKAGLVKSGMPEDEAEAKAREGGHAAGAIEAGGELAADLIPFGALAKPFAKPVAGALVRSIFGGGIKKAAGTLAKIEAGEVATEMAQQAGEKEVEAAYGADHEGATIKDTASVIVPTALMSLLPGGLTVAHNFHTIGKVKSALEQGDADQERRAAAAGVVFHELAANNPSVAQAFDQYAADQIAAEKPIEIKDDDFYTGYANKIAAERAFPPAQPTPAEQAGIDANAGPLSAAAATALNTGASQAATEARAAPISEAAQAQQEEQIRAENPDLSDEEVAQRLRKAAEDEAANVPEEDAAALLPPFPGMRRPDTYIEDVQRRRAEAGKEAGEETQPLPPKQLMPLPTVEAAKKAADAMSKRTGEAYDVVPHPYRSDQFAIVPAGRVQEFSKTKPSDLKEDGKKPSREPVTIEGEAKRVTDDTGEGSGTQASKAGSRPAAPALPAPKKEADAASTQVQGPAEVHGADENVPADQANVARPGQGKGPDAGRQGGAELPPFRQVAAALARKAQTPVDAGAHEAATSPLNGKEQPSQAKAAIGRYEKGRADVGPFKLAFENPEGSQRSNFDTKRVAELARTIPADANSLSLKGKAKLEEATALAEQGQFDQAIERTREAANLLLAQHPIHSETADEIAESSWANVMKAHYGYAENLPISRADKDRLDFFVKPGTKPDHNGPLYVIDQPKKGGGFDEHKIMAGYASPVEAAAAYKAHYPKDWKVGTITPTTPEELIAWAKTGDTSKPFSERASSKPKSKSDEFNERMDADVAARDGLPEDFRFTNKDRPGAVPHAEIQIQKYKDGKFIYRVAYMTPGGGSGGPLIRDGATFDTRDEALAAAVADLRKQTNPETNKGHASEATNGAHTKMLVRINEWLDTIGQDPEKIAAEAKAKAKAEKEAEKQRKQAIRSAQTDLYTHAKNSDGFRTWHEQDDAAIREALAAMAPKMDSSAPPHIVKDPALITDELVKSLKAESAKVDAKLKKAEAKAEAEKVKEANALKKKLTNTGADLRRHWELEKAKLKARNDAEGITAMNQIFAMTQRADFFRLPDEATPGARKIVEAFRDTVQTFKEWVTQASGSPINPWYGEGAQQAIERFMKEGDRGNVEKWRGIVDDKLLESKDWRPTVDDRVKLLAKWADDYVTHLSAMSERITSQKSAQGVLVEIQSYLWTPEAHQILAREHGTQTEKKNPSAFEKPSWHEFAFGSLTQARMTEAAWKAYKANVIGATREPIAQFLPYWTYRGISDYVINEHNDFYAGKTKPLVPPRLEKIERTVPTEIRKGDVTPKKFKETFGFADVGFGSWVGAKEDQTHLNYSYDAFMDLANHLGIDPKQIGFGGKLHFTIGALGHGAKAAATFHPMHPGPNGTFVKAINVTKTKGDGTVAHEWLHALDDHLESSEVGARAMREIRDALATAFDFERARKSAMAWITSSSSSTRRQTKLDNAAQNLRYYRHRPGETSYKAEADKLGADYWGNDKELRARAWEAYIGDTLNGINDYLVNVDWSGDGKAAPPTYRGTPYPKGEERKRFNEWYKHLVESLVVNESGTLDVDPQKWDANKPPGKAEYQAAIDAMIADLPALMAQHEAEKEAATAKQIREQEEAQAAAAAAQKREEEAAAAQPAPAEPAGELTDDDLEALFDAAAENVTAETRENVTAPEPGEPAFRDEPELEATPKESVGTAPPTFALRKVGDELKLVTNAQELQHITQAGKELIGVLWEGVTREQAQEVDKYTFPKRMGMGGVSGFFIRMRHVERPAAKVQPETAKTGSELLNDRIKSDVAAKDEKAAGQLIAEAAKLGVKGIDEALTGLTKLFGGGKIQSFPGGFDQKTYEEAKPHFVEALKAFQAAGRTLKEFFEFLIAKLGVGVKPYAIAFAKEMKLTAQLGDKPDATTQVADWVQNELDNGRAFAAPALYEKANAAFGGTMGEGKYTPKDAYDAVEMGVNRLIASRLYLAPNNDKILGMPPSSAPMQAKNIVGQLTTLTNLLPTFTQRTGEQDEFQQFSTPPALAFVANWVANIKPGETYLEPSAGIGGLAVFGKLAGAVPVLNELSSRRAEILRKVLPGAQVTSENAEMIHDILPDDIRPTVVVMNPPFSATAGRVEGQRDTMNGAKHVLSALDRLVPGGRLVAIVGDMNTTSARWVEFWNKVKAQHTVRANVEVNGAEYRKYGTTFDNRIIVIDKVGPHTGDIVTGRAESYAELPDLLKSVRELRREPSRDDIAPEQVGSQLPSGGTATSGVAQPGSTQSPVTRDDGAGQGDRGGDAGTPGQPGTSGVGGRAPGGGKPGGGAGNARPGDQPGGTGRPDAGTSGADSAGSDQGLAGSGVVLDGEGITRRNAELTDAVFEAYEPRKAKVAGAKQHPSALVESAAMASVEPVDVTYVPNLPKELVEKGLASGAQLEAVIYAGQAHQQTLPDGSRRGYFIGDGTGVGKGREISTIIMDNMRQGRKKHLWLSAKAGLKNDAIRDYTGVGGNAEDLFALADEAGEEGQSAANVKVKRKSGVMFTTYATMRQAAKVDTAGAFPPGSKVQVGQLTELGELVGINVAKRTVKVRFGEKVKPYSFGDVVSINNDRDYQNTLNKGSGKVRSRLDQIVEWLGEDFDGCIIFDEAHNMGNLGGEMGERGAKEASAQAIAGRELQSRLPQARVVYVSATGATEVANLMYATRLGLWGPGTVFPDDKTFVAEISSAGLSTMELVARDLKLQGSYIARSISYEGVTYRQLDVPLTQLQSEAYDTLAIAWQIVLKDIRAAMEQTDMAKSKDKGNIMSQFWGAQLRFFNQVITAMQVPEIIEDAKKQIAQGNAILFQLVNTDEATQEKLASKAEAEGKDLEELDFSPRETLIDFVRKSYPVVKYIEVADPGGGKPQYVPAKDSQGKPILDKALVAARDKLIKDIEQIKSVPSSPVDAIINELGEDVVAEVTGRNRRFLTKVVNGEIKVEEQKRGVKAREADAQAFIDDKKRALIFSDAGGTGFSYHSDRGYKNQRQRVHYLVQPGWRADNAVQGFGRSHRTNEANQPEYVLPRSNAIRAQKRFISSIARRLDQLGALTKGQRNTTSGGMFTNRDNLESKYAQAAMRDLLNDLGPNRAELFPGLTPSFKYGGEFGNRADLPTGGITNAEIVSAMGLDGIYARDTGELVEANVPPMRKFMNRLLSLTLAQQDIVFGEFERRFDAAVDAAIEKGTFDDGMQTVKALAVKKTRDESVFTDPRSNAQTRFVEFELTKPTTLNTFEQAVAAKDSHPGRGWAFYRDNQTGEPFIAVDEGVRMGGNGRPQHRGYRISVRAPSLAQRGRYIDNMDSIKNGGGTHIFRQEREPQPGDTFQGKTVVEQRGTRYTQISASEAEYLWSEAHDAAPKTYTEPMSLLTGILLPVWDRVKVGKDARAAAVVRTQTDEGERFIGRLVPEADRAAILKNFGLGAIRSDIPTQDLINRINKGEIALLSNGWRVKRVKVANENRLEVLMTRTLPAELRQLTDAGAIVTRIDWADRIFIPNGPTQVQVFEAITRGANRPVVDFANTTPTLEITAQGRGAAQASGGMSLEAAGQRAALPPGMSKTQLRGVILPIIQKWKNGPTIKIVQYAHELPFQVPWNTRGAVHEGVTYLVADNMHTPEAAQFVLLHEVAGHYGLRGMFGTELDPLLERIYHSNPKVKAAADKRRAQYKKAGWDLSIAGAAEEALADIAGRRELENVAGWKLLVAAIRAALRKIGFTIKMSDNDVAAVLRDARRFVETPPAATETIDIAAPAETGKLELGSGLIARAVQEVYDATSSAKQFNWLHTRVSTQFHKAQINPYFRPVFVAAQQYLQDVSAFAHKSADLAGEDILPRLGKLSDVWRNWKPSDVSRINTDLDAAGKAIWAATLGDMRPTREQLLSGFTVTAKDDARIIGEIDVPALTEKQVEYYERVRASIDLSLDQVAVSEMARMAKNEGIPDALAMAKEDAANGYDIITQALHEQAATLRQDGSLEAAKKKEALIEQLAEQQSRVEMLKEQGYAPLMRFGQYTVRVTGMTTSADPETLYFGMFESRSAANKMAREMQEQYPDATVTRGVMDEESWKLYRGMSLDSIEAFARAIGIGEWPLMQEYLKNAVSSRSALKRLIHRKGIQGFDEDVRRVLASFITSQARMSSRNYHFAEMTDAHAKIPAEMGDVKGEAAKLINYVQNPVEEAQALRGMLFVNFIGGSVASALTNMTQPVMMTLPYLSQFGGPGRAGKALADALSIAGGGVATDPELRAAMDRAAEQGITEPQELHQLYAESIRSSIGSTNIWARKGLRVWGSMFSLAETFNRRITFAAAFQMANREGAMAEINRVRAERNLPGFATPFDFAESAVEDTQGIYNRGNRPNWARGAIGATLFTFKQFTIAYLEFLTRLPPRERALAGAILVLAAGLQGLPGADDLENLIDTIGQLMGYNTNSKKVLREGAVKILGESMGGFLTHGFSGIPGVPLDVQGRLGIRQLIPLSGIFKRSETDKGEQVMDAIGPAGGMVQQVQKGAAALAAGNWAGFFAQGTPVAVQSALKGFDMWQTGIYKDTRGRKVIDTDRTDAVLKALGIQPQDVAMAQRKSHDVRQDVEMAKTVESGIAERWARGILDRDQDQIQKAIAEWQAWNVKNPETPILITPLQIKQRVEQAMQERAIRTVKAAPKELRRSVFESLR